jgi:AraC-like DNA-binding protein
MKARLIERISTFDRSFNAEIHGLKHFLKIWHYHPALELVYMVKSKGTRFIGDNISKFEEGELVLVGENLPHSWQNDAVYFDKENNFYAEAYVIHFQKDFAGSRFFDLPEMKSIDHLIGRAQQGILFTGKVKDFAKARMEGILGSDGFQRLLLFLKFLKELADEPNYDLLSTPGFSLTWKKSGDNRLDKLYAYVMDNFKHEIKLEEAASLVNLNPTAFCRFFKQSTNKTFLSFLNEIRIGYACRLLLEKNRNISEVGFECGFNNLSNFNRQFKSFMKMSPSEYLKFHRNH